MNDQMLTDQMNIINTANSWCSGQNKRRRQIGVDVNEDELPNHNYQRFSGGRESITIHSCNARVYQTECWTDRDSSIFIPISDDVTIRISSYDQFTYPVSTTPYFIGDSCAQYTGCVHGSVVHMWKYSSQDRQLFIARSLLFPSESGCYHEFKSLLQQF